ncbi:MAG: major facilitator superfamily 1 [Gemmataceae bacterium]|nr:major facilitator superfamily 1 [Gemmataceae bacterium]
MDTPSRLTRAAWVVVGLLWAVALLNYLDRQLVVTMSRPIKADLAIGDARFGLFPSIFLWIYGLCSPVAGYVADRVGKRPVIIASLLVWSAATAYTGVVESFEAMLAARAVLGVSEAFYMPAAVALIVDYHRGPTRARATGFHLSGVYAGQILGGLGGWLAEDFGWRVGFLLFGGVGVFYALVLMVLLPPPPDAVLHSPLRREGVEGRGPAGISVEPTPRGFTAGAFAVLLSAQGFVLLLAMNLLNGAAYWPVRNWLPTFFQDEFGISQTLAGIYGPTTFNAAAFAGMLLGSTVSDRWARTNPRARVLVPAIGFCVAAPCLFAVGAAGAVPVILGCILAVGASQGFLDANLMPATCTVTDPRFRATAYGLLNFVGTTAGGVMTFVGGVLKEEHVPFGITFQAAAGFILLAGLLLFAVKPNRIS